MVLTYERTEPLRFSEDLDAVDLVYFLETGRES